MHYEQQRTYFLGDLGLVLRLRLPEGTKAGRTNVVWKTIAPRLGVTYTSAPQTVVKGHFERYYLNLADAHATAKRGERRGGGTPFSTRTRTASTTGAVLA